MSIWTIFVVLLVVVVNSTHSRMFTGFSFHFIGGHGNKNAREYYSILGLTNNASEKDIKTAYRTKAMSMHPDKGQLTIFAVV